MVNAIPKQLVVLMIVVFVSLMFMGLSCSDTDSSDDDDDNDTTNNNSSDDDTSNDDDDDDLTPGSTLFAAAGQTVITPNTENHPETIYLGGIFPSRLATGVHDDLLAAALMLKKGDEEVVLVSLDLLGFTRTRGREIQEQLAEYGLVKEHILIASTHTHEAPDTIGVFGPNVLTSGVSPTYMTFLRNAVVDLVLQLRENLMPVNMKAVRVEVNDPLSNYPTLTADLREPTITVPWLSTAQFIDEAGVTVATLLNWHTHPEVMIESTEISADFPQWARQRMETQLGGASVYISGALGGLATPTGVEVPARSENGEPISDDDGNPLYYLEGTWEKARSLGFVIADLALEALNEAEVIIDPDLTVDVEELLLPVTNPIMFLAYITGLVEFEEADVVQDQPEFCGWFGCSSDRLAVVRFGPVALVTSPGETFPETLIGREKSVVDFGEGWGEFTFSAIDGIEAHMDTTVPMHMSVCGNETGYLIPAADFHAPNHPDYYEEELFWGFNTETLYRQTAIDMLNE